MARIEEWMEADDGRTVAEREEGAIILLQIVPFVGEGAGQKLRAQPLLSWLRPLTEP